MDSRLTEPTFTSDEVRELLSGLSGAVKADVESELISTSHTNVLLLRQLFTQAEKWHLKLQVNVSEMENRWGGEGRGGEGRGGEGRGGEGRGGEGRGGEGRGGEGR